MKKKLALLLAGCMLLSVLGGCGSDEQNKETESNDTQVQEQESQTSGTEESKETVEPINLIDVKVEDYVTLGEYKGLDLTFAAKETFDEDDVDALALSAYNNYVTADLGGVKDRAAQLGDTVNIDYEGKLDGVAFEGGTAKGADLALGSGSFIDGFEDGLVGVKPGETVDLNLTFPDPYNPNPEMSGAKTVFTVTVNFIYPTNPASMLDEVVTSMENEYFKNVAELKEYCREYLGYNVEEVYKTGQQNAALNALIGIAEVKDAPEGLVENYRGSIYTSLTMQAAQYGLDVETYCAYFTGMDAASYVSAYAAESAKQSMIIQYIANKENLNVDDDELDKCIKEFAEKNKVDEETVRASDDEEMLREYFMFEKVLEFVVANANVTETAAE